MTKVLAKNTFYLTFASIGQKLIAFVYFLFVARVMQPELTGQYFLSVSIALMFSVLADFGITPVVIRETAKAPEKTRELLSRVLVLKIPLLFVGYFSAILAAFILGYDLDILLLTIVAGISIILDSVHLLFYGVLRGHQQLWYESVGMFAGQALTAIAGAFVLWLAPSLLLLVSVLTIGSLLNVLSSSVILWKRFGPSIFLPTWDPVFAKKILRMALPFALAAIFVKVYSYVDTLFISKFLDTAAVGLYSIAYKFTYAFQFLPLAFTAALYPSLSQAIEHDRTHLPQLFRRALWYMMILSTPLVFGIWLIADQAVLLAGDAYRSAAPILSTLVFVLIPIFLDFPVGSLLNAANKQMTKTVIMGITMVMNILLNAFLVPTIGMMGAAVAALISFSFMFFAGFFFVRRIIPEFSFPLFLKDILRIALCGGVMALIGTIMIPIIGWIAVIPVCGVVYMIGLLFTRVLTFKDFSYVA